ncbi:MAG: hypothetical protein ABI216_21615 [Devosia sp.]
MNAEQEAPFIDPVKDVAAFASLALTQRRLAHRNRKWALEDEARGDLPAYRKHRSEAKRLWHDAKYHLWCAQDRKDRISG